MGAYAGKILKADLTSGRIEDWTYPEELRRTWLGGSGMGVRIFLDLIRDKPRFDALSPDNPSVLMTGPLTGLRMSAVARFVVCAKSPLTGVWGESNCGGYFGPELKFAGYDGIILTGASAKPVYLFIEDGKAELRDASAYWGLDTYTCTDKMIADHAPAKGGKKGQVFCIGPGGERLIPFASIQNNKGHTSGRTGMGAVWGSKKLKGIFVRGSGKIGPQDEEAFKTFLAELKELHDGNITVAGLKEFGTPSHMDVGIIMGDIPMRNWSRNEWEEFDSIAPLAYGEKVLTGNKTCYACAVACKREAEVKDGPFKMEKGPGPEYETVGSFGTICLNASMESICKANEICNRQGIDTIQTGACVAFALECFEAGLITAEQAGGLDLTWGNAEAIVALTERIATRAGWLGELLSHGTVHAAKEIGGGAENFVVSVRRLDAPMHDGRAAWGYQLAYATSTRGACHMSHAQYMVEGGGMFLPEFPETADAIDEHTIAGKPAMVVRTQDYGNFFGQASIFCNLGSMILNATQACAAVSAAVGYAIDPDEACRIGERMWYAKRALGNLWGSGKSDDALPPRLRMVMESGPTAGFDVDLETMLAEYYALRDLDGEGRPTRAKLEAIGLPDVADLLGV
jgi:aldehyde:ferredoxin oxidoreductase